MNRSFKKKGAIFHELYFIKQRLSLEKVQLQIFLLGAIFKISTKILCSGLFIIVYLLKI